GVAGTTYTVRYTTNGTCDNTATDTVTVNPNPECSITGDDTICLQDTKVMYSGPDGDYSYSWSVTGGNIIGDDDEQTVYINPTSDGTMIVELTVTDNTTKCTATCDLDVTVYDCCEDETAYAYNTTYSGINNLCFLDASDRDVIRENRWGWTLDNLDLDTAIANTNGSDVYNSYTFNLYAGNGNDCDPTDGPGELVGTVTISRDATNISIEYDLNDATDDNYYSLYGLHANLGCTQFARKKKGRRWVNTTAPGQYNVTGNANGENSAILTVPVSEIDCLNDMYAIFHAEVEVCTFEPTVPSDVSTQEEPKGKPKKRTAVTSFDFRAYPMPFKNNVNVSFESDFDTDITIEVIDLQGRIIVRKEVRDYKKGMERINNIDLSNTNDHILFLRVTTKEGVKVKKIISNR
ncbi:MAG: T9SS type A sorting domain-containing protein, partial [Flavobacteriaceae bacterium]|nr:T9SS type A sorting domain-containing protein [Flavobacteriaceae bacterium]